jgi:hypothetical protein
MKTGRTLQELAAEITRQQAMKRDFVANTSSMEMKGDGTLLLQGKDTSWHGGINDLAHDQIADHAKIPHAYYKRMRSEGELGLLADNVNRWFAKYPAPRMLRTLDGGARAFLSNSFRRLENADLAEAVLPIMLDKKLNIMSCEITEKRLYLKAVDERLFRDVPVGYKMGDGSHRVFDTCAPAIIVSNSEVGCGRLVVESGVFTKACTNMALFADGGMRRTHVGARHRLLEDSVESIDHLLSDKTRQVTDQALWLQVRDIVAGALDHAKLAKRVEQLTATAENKIAASDAAGVVELAAERFSLSTTEGKSVLGHLIEGGNLSQYGLHAAITRAASDVEDYDRATELEYVGGRVIELSRSDWQSLVAA